MSSQSWEREYANPSFITKNTRPQEDFLKFLQWLKKIKNDALTSLQVLDLGCGIGRNSLYLANKYHVKVTAIDFSKNAIRLAKEHFSHENIHFVVDSISEPFPLEDESVGLVLDIMSSFSLTEVEREKYLQEINRVLKSGGFMYVRTLKKEADKNAGYLLKNNPGKEKDTYIHPTLGSHERVFSELDFRELYTKYFDIVKMQGKSGYQKFDGQPYKRNYWNVYLQKKNV